ncbi:MAG: hypothetical protein ACLFPX_06850 [Candidatus Omnitrophota bacterium]
MSRFNEEGFLLLTVIVMIIVLSVLVVGIMSLNVGQVRTGQSVVDSIKAEEFAKGVMYKYAQAQYLGVSYDTDSVELDGRTFGVDISDLGTTGSPNLTNRIQINAEWD